MSEVPLAAPDVAAPDAAPESEEALYVADPEDSADAADAGDELAGAVRRK